MDAISAISQRIAQIQSMVADPALAVSATTTGAASTSSGTGFATALAEALAAGSGAATGGASSSPLDGAGLAGSSSSLLAALGLTNLSDLGAGGTTSGTTAVGVLDANGVPADLAGYGNGNIPASALAPVGTTGARMWQPAAQALARLIGAAKADGVTIGVTEGYRPYAEQMSLAATKGLYSQGGLAAAPGTSEHGWGMAADLGLDSTGLAWMRQNADRFGYVADTPRESWHWAYHPAGS